MNSLRKIILSIALFLVLVITGCSQGKEATYEENCEIKGNISYRTGEKIYHLPHQNYYDRTKIDESKGERWFCSEEEAKNAGWRRSKR